MYMWEASLEGLLMVLQPFPMLIMILAIILGSVVAILPGIGSVALLSMALPFAMALPPPAAIALVVGIHAVANTASGLTSSLTGIPGSSASVATILDGYPMAKRGEGARAVGAAVWCSVMGGVFGALILTAVLPLMRPLVLAMGAAEMFMMTLLGVSMVAMLSGKAKMKGLIAAGLGIMIMMVGLDPKSGTERWVFGQAFLWDGIDLVLAVMGVYAMPEVIALAVSGTSIAGDAPKMGRGMIDGVKDCFKYWFLTLRTSALGAVFGIIPGLGSTTIAWLAYGHAVQTEKNGTFGKGDIRGVIAPEAANNSVDAGSYITALGFGIPTGTPIALILIVLIAVGIKPGPSMLTDQLPLTFSIIWTLTLANVIGGIGALALANPIAKMTFWPARVIVPVIVVLVYLGAYTANYAMSDFVLLIIFTALGFFMKQFGWPRAPMLLGLVLAGPMEKYLWIAAGAYGFDWLLRPGVIIIFLFIAGSAILLPIWQARQKAAEKAILIEAGIEAEKARLKEAEIKEQTGMKFRPQSVLTLVVVILLGIGIASSLTWPFRANILVLTIGGACWILSVIQLFRELRSQEVAESSGMDIELADDQKMENAPMRIVSVSLWLVGLVLGIWFLGLYIAVLAWSFLYAYRHGSRWWVAALICAICWAFMYGLLDQAIHMPFPDPLLPLPRFLTGV